MHMHTHTNTWTHTNTHSHSRFFLANFPSLNKHSFTLTFILSHTLSHALSQSHSFHFIRFIHSLSLCLSTVLHSLSPFSLSLSLYHSCYLSLATVLPSHCLPPLSHSICLSSLTLCASLQFLTHSLSPFSPSHTHPFAQAAHSHHLFSSDFFRCVTFQVFFQPSIEKKRKEGLESLESTQLKSRVTKAFFGQIHIDRRSHSSKTLRGSD